MLDPKIFDIFYFIALPNEDLSEATQFQGFTLGNYWAMEFIYKILFMPQNILEMKAGKEETIRSRILGLTYINLIPVEERFIEMVLGSSPTPFTIVYSLESNHDLIDDIISKCGRPVLHVSKAKSMTALKVEDLKVRSIWDFCQGVRAFLCDKSPELNRSFDDVFGSKRDWETESCGVKKKKHFFTMPNEVLLRSFSYGLGMGPEMRASNLEDCVLGITDSANVIIDIQHKILKEKINYGKTSLILASFGMYKHVYSMYRVIEKETGDVNFRKSLRKVMKCISKQKEYDFRIETENTGELQIINHVFGIRRREAGIFTAALSVMACSSFSAVIRLPPGVSLLGDCASQLISCSNALPNPNKYLKLNRLFKTVQQKMAEFFYPKYSETVNQSGRCLKLVSDAPLEWLPLNGLPLMVLKNISRIPVTPGNLMMQQALVNNRLTLTLNDIKKVLVLKSFNEKDGIKDFLEYSIRVFSGVSKKFKLEIVYKKISSADEFISEIDAFDGSILIYDGHGCYEKDTDFTGLVLGDEVINIWSLKGRLKRMPPIVILSACDTHSLGASHVTSSNGFLSLGASTVLSTLMPVSAKESAIMIGRLIYRIEEYLPTYLEHYGNVLRWIDLVGGLFRMVYMSDLKKFLFMRLKPDFTVAQYKRIGYMSNHYINSDDEDWYNKSIKCFSDETGVNIDAIYSLLEKGYFSEVLKYIQIGNPENIVLVENEEI